MSIDARSAAIAVVLLLGAFGITLAAYDLIDDSDSPRTVAVQPTATLRPGLPSSVSPTRQAVLGTGTTTVAVVSVTPRPVLTPTPAGTATPTPLPDRRDCNAIAGTEYRSEAERAFYLANCLSQSQPVASTSTPQFQITILPTQPSAPTATRTPTFTPTPTATRTPSIIATPTRAP